MGICIGRYKKTPDIETVYTFHEQIGKGVMATVYKGVHKKLKEEVAIKVIEKKRLFPSEIEDVIGEVNVLQSLDHPNIVKLKEFIEDDEHYYVIMELVYGGELRQRIIEKTIYTEKETRNLVFHLISTIQYIHQKGIVHRDLKLDNLLLRENNDDENIVIADFGVAARIDQGLTKLCGTPWYIAPEILKKQHYGIKADMWSIGVILFILLGGSPPFYDKNERNLFQKIREGDYSFRPVFVWECVSDEAKDLVRHLLNTDPAKRLSAEQALEHPWFHLSDDVLEGHQLMETQEELSHCSTNPSIHHFESFREDGIIHSGCSIRSIDYFNPPERITKGM